MVAQGGGKARGSALRSGARLRRAENSPYLAPGRLVMAPLRKERYSTIYRQQHWHHY